MATVAAKLFEGENLDYEYVPIEVGMDWSATVDKHDLGMMETVALLSLALARNTNVVSRPMGTGNNNNNNASAKTRFQVTRDNTAQTYHMVFNFPLHVQISYGKLARIHALFPNRIIGEETRCSTNPKLTSQDLSFTIWMHTRSFYDRAEIFVLHADPVVQVTHVYPEPVGKNGEGRGVKRQREATDSPANDRAVKSRKDE